MGGGRAEKLWLAKSIKFWVPDNDDNGPTAPMPKRYYKIIQLVCFAII